MKTNFQQKALLAALLLACMTCFVFPAYAAVKQTGSTVVSEIGPGIEPAPEVENTDTEETVPGESLGVFNTTAYCHCPRCSGNGLTYSGSVPTPNHTLSADLSVFPLGTKLYIDGTIYTVEDKGSGVNGNELDIYFSSHEEALQYGRKNVEVFSVLP